MQAIEWFQSQPNVVPLTCRRDGTKLIGQNSHVGTTYLECPLCGVRYYRIPPHVLKSFSAANDIPSGGQIVEAIGLADSLNKKIPSEVLSSAMKIKNYINALKGQLIERGVNHGNSKSK